MSPNDRLDDTSLNDMSVCDVTHTRDMTIGSSPRAAPRGEKHQLGDVSNTIDTTGTGELHDSCVSLVNTQTARQDAQLHVGHGLSSGHCPSIVGMLSALCYVCGCIYTTLVSQDTETISSIYLQHQTHDYKFMVIGGFEPDTTTQSPINQGAISSHNPLRLVLWQRLRLPIWPSKCDTASRSSRHKTLSSDSILVGKCM